MNFSSWKSTFVIFFGIGVWWVSYPYVDWPIDMYLKFIWFLVRVPVLSENICWICPSYSFSELVWTITYAGFVVLNLELLMLMPWMYFTISRDTISEIGTKFVNNKIQLPHLINSRWKKLKYSLRLRSNECFEAIAKKALSKVISIWVRKINATMIPILNYSLDFFWRVLLLFNMILVSTPV